MKILDEIIKSHTRHSRLPYMSFLSLVNRFCENSIYGKNIY